MLDGSGSSATFFVLGWVARKSPSLVRRIRRADKVPAVVYGEKKEPLSIHVEEKLLYKMLLTGHFMNSVVMIDFEGKPHRTLPKAVDFHPVTSRPTRLAAPIADTAYAAPPADTPRSVRSKVIATLE